MINENLTEKIGKLVGNFTVTMRAEFHSENIWVQK